MKLNQLKPYNKIQRELIIAWGTLTFKVLAAVWVQLILDEKSILYGQI